MNPIPVNEPRLTHRETELLLQCIESGWISSEGPYINAFEKTFSSLVGRQWGIAVSSGSAALDVAVKAIGITPGDEVIMPTFTIISPAASVVRAGGIPVLVDSDPITWNMNIAQIESKITPRTKAILVVHIYGLPVDMQPILALAKQYHLNIIEDAAEMHGQTYLGQPCGSFGDISIFSFYSNKLVTTGEGGMIVTDNAELAERCRSLRNLSFLPHRRFLHEELGWNFRMSSLQAALGIAQCERFQECIQRKRWIGRLYTEELADVPDIQLPLQRTQYADNIYWVYGIVLADTLPFDANAVIASLAHKGINTRPFFWPMHEQPVFKKMGLFKNESYPVAERLARRGLYLPSGLTLTEQQIKRVSEKIKSTMGCYA